MEVCESARENAQEMCEMSKNIIPLVPLLAKNGVFGHPEISSPTAFRLAVSPDMHNSMVRPPMFLIKTMYPIGLEILPTGWVLDAEAPSCQNMNQFKRHRVSCKKNGSEKRLRSRSGL